MNEDDLTFSDFLKTIDQLGKGEWTTVYSSRDGLKGPGFYSALIKNQLAKRSLEQASWDIRIGDGAPGFVTTFRNGKQKTQYMRSSDEGIEPLVIKRHFHSIRPGYWEVSEDFRLYFNLFEDRVNRKFVQIDDNGDEHDAILISDTEIKVKTLLIRQYLTARKMKLAIFFDYSRFSGKTLEELSIKKHASEERSEDRNISIAAGPWRGFSNDENKRSHARALGKRLISGDASFRPRKVGERPERKHIDFIIGIDEEGKEILHTSDEAKLSNYFGANPGEPHYLTPVFFRKEVLSKYYSRPEKYTVNDGHLTCGGLWSLYIDNNHPESVMVFLGDLGHLSHTEQMYWRGFNLSSGKMSHIAFRRSILGQFTDPDSADLYFKQKFSVFNDQWKRQFDWDLFKPLTGKDEYYLKILRVPLTNDQREFDEQILALAKVFIDSLNEKELARGVTNKEEAKGLDKLEAWLRSKGFSSDSMMEFMRKLQALRSACAAHIKGDRYEKLKPFFKIDEMDLRSVLDDIFIKCVWTLRTIAKAFLPTFVEERSDEISETEG